MTESDVRNLSLSHLYEFSTYYGESKVGLILLREEGSFFVTEEIIASNKEFEKLTYDLLESIDLDSIIKWKPTYWRSRQSSINQHFDGKKDLSLKATKLIIIGAGASAGYSSFKPLEMPERPPLVNEIFHDAYEDLLNKHPGVKQLASLVSVNSNIESFFQKKWNQVKRKFHPDLLYKIINTQFYLQELFYKVSFQYKDTRYSNYNILSEMISDYRAEFKEQILVVTFNYDTLFESALSSSINVYFDSIGNYILKTNPVILFKPHGSWNWVRYLKEDVIDWAEKSGNLSFSKYLFDKRFDYSMINEKLEDRTDIIKSFHPYTEAGKNKIYVPQLLIPFTDKDEFVMPDTHSEMMDFNLGNIEDILIVGWKGMEKAFQNSLRKSLGKKEVNVYVVNRADEVDESLKKCLPSAIWHNTGYDFQVFMRQSQDNGHPFFEKS